MVKAAPGRNLPPAPFTKTVSAKTIYFSRSIAPRLRKRSWKASCSAMRKAHSPAPSIKKKASSKLPRVAAFFWMRWANCPLRSRRNCCAFSRSANSSASAERAPSSSTSASWQPPTRICRWPFVKGSSGEIFTTVSTSSRSPCPLSASTRKTSRFLPNSSPSGTRRNAIVRKEISAEAHACLMQYDWPGNVRELENAMERAVVIGSSDFILPEDLPEAVLETAQSTAFGPANYHDAVRNLKKQLIQSAWEQSGGSFTEAARILGVHANYLHRLIRNLDLRMALKKNAKA